MNRAKKINGFTLVELLISVAIVGIIASIAYPSYQDSVQRSHRTDGKAALLNLVNVMERSYTETGDYTLVADPDPTPYYTITIDPITTTAATYTLLATPISGSGQENDPCGTLGIDQAGNKTADIAGCW